MSTVKTVALFVVGVILAFLATSGAVYILKGYGGAADLIITGLLGFGGYKALRAGGRRAKGAAAPARDPQYDRDWSL